ncbi:hypothetical protein H4582DRAFT_2084063 [Lactarius indigo]|nr:hypothetical protein H4582DRAFT_2084063 [Lactarius indigo]
MFEVSPQASVVTSTNGKLLCSYPGPAVQVSAEIFSNGFFLRELASFLIQMDIDVLDSTATAVKAGSTVREVRESAHPKYITELLVGILRGFGRPASVDRIMKRIGDEVLWKDAYKPWRRSPLWLVIKVALQTSLDSNMYKSFMLVFHTYILNICIQRSFSSEMPYLMRVKIARRLSKLGPAVSDGVYQAVYHAAKNTETLLQNRWSSFQKNRAVSLAWLPEQLDVVSDVTITLNNSRPFLINALHLTFHSYSSKSFSPSHRPRLASTLDFGHLSDGQLAAAVAEDKRTALADFESSVERYLDSWVDAYQHDENAPDVIASYIEQYFDIAKDTYGADPEDNSVMIFTVMGLWMALDQLTTQQCPLLASYSPEISFILYSFIAPAPFKRATLIEEHILQRHQEASYTTSIFSDSVTESSFAPQYFRTSQRLQQLEVEIIQHAWEERNLKRAELDSLNGQWQLLKYMAAEMDHAYLEDNRGNSTHRNKLCQKCQTNKAANRLKISVHEWPLPQATVQAQLVIFELSPPRAFSTWREITYKILCDIGTPNVSDDANQPKVLLDTFSGLTQWAARHEYHRITIGSTTKSFGDQTHYKMVQFQPMIPMSYSTTGYPSNCMIPFLGTSVANLCTPLIPVSSPYGKIHSFVCGTHHTPNEVIAGQADCPPELTPHEYLAFSELRSGPRLQWLNIARELSSPSLSFRREGVHTLITQAAWHLGLLSDGVREWHTDLGIPSFGWTLVRELEGLLGRIEANWLEEVTARTIALITSRLLSSTRDRDIRQRAYALLRRARSVSHKWIVELGLKLDMIEDEMSRTNLRRRLCTLAATCFSTYDVCQEHIPWTLASDDDIATAVYCAVIVHDNTPSILEDDHSRYLNRLLNRHRRLLHFLEPSSLRECVPSNPSGFDQGLAGLWPGFRRQNSSNWHVLPSPNSRWISCIVEGGHEVHYNLLTGQLLIGGKPLGRLPQEIISHSTYASVLGARILDVVPADIPWMEFMTRSNVSGYQIYFSLRDGNLILQAQRREDPRLLQFVPRAVFVDDFPRAFLDDHVHWLNLRTGEVEFRPVESPWTSDPSNWRLTVHIDDTPSLFRKISADGVAPVDLIDIRSATFQMISRLLSPLESPEHIIVTCTNHALEASLGRLHLVFFVNQNSELEFLRRDFWTEKNQLVLRASNRSSEMPRRVIIPQGDIEFGLDGDFASVSIKTGATRNVHWHEYTIDTDLGRLTGNVSLHSKLYQCYLHALTSHYLLGPLLGHTGTEESFNMLQSAAFLSFQRLGNDDVKLLNLISDLTPIGAYYPPHLRSMVTVEWNDLPVLSQLLSRLSDLADRRIFYVPFSRNLQMSAFVVQSISTLYRRCAEEGGVLVVQPEHLLSQKLMCIDTLLTSDDDCEKHTITNEIKALQGWLARVSRDVLDESDDILHVRYQLVYTAGVQMPVEDHPNRWSTTQQIFSRLRSHAERLHANFPQMFELDQTQRGFPAMRILHQKVSRQISLLISEDALGGALSTLPLTVLPPLVRDATRRFITQRVVSVEDHQLIRSHCSGTTLWSGILLLHGLLVDGDGILGYVLKERRWRVDYGLDPSRTFLAVPYHAKQQVLQCFDLLIKLDNPDMEYDEWVEFGEGIHTSLRQVKGVNVNDDTQLDKHLVPLFSRNTRVIDFYLSLVVFPRVVKGFPSKLSTSAWDLVEDKSNVTTGFSGTNDNRFLLPTSMTQEDPVSQLSTNALVMQYLLQPENNHYEHKPEIRVLLDVGAQMLELPNEELARHWLSLKPHISAAIFFNELDHLTVLTQDGTVEPLISSPFNRQLDRCIVYFDDAHTRGTDLKLPRGTRAAVTLGPKVTKDRLLQGKEHSVMFFAPGEVDRRIRGLISRGQDSEKGVRVTDVLRWAMHETCWDIVHHLPHWAQQGVDHHRRFSAYKRYDSTGELKVLRSSWLQPESKTLEEIYEPVSRAQGAWLGPEINSVPSLRERLERLGVTRLTDVRMAEEQEREVNHEVEVEGHAEYPPKVFPAEHIICGEIRHFVSTGVLAKFSMYIIPLFTPTEIDKALDSTAGWTPSPLATIDFAITTTDSSITDSTDYLRPVNWILSSGFGKESVAIVISPYEANELLPNIRKSGKVRLHVYAPRVTASMRSFSDLTFYTVPESPEKWTAAAHLRTELDLFARQLYFDTIQEYRRLCALLALHIVHPGAKLMDLYLQHIVPVGGHRLPPARSLRSRG